MNLLVNRLDERLSAREAIIFSLLKEHGEMTLEALAEAVSRKEGKPIKPGAVNVAIKYMAYKFTGSGWSVINTAGGRGRGNKASFKLEQFSAS